MTQLTSPRPVPEVVPTTGTGSGIPNRSWRPRLPRLGALAYLAPVLATMLVWIYGPLVWTVVMSFFDWNLTDVSPEPVGLDNYISLLGDRQLHESLVVTATLTLALLPLVVAAPLAAAAAVWQHAGRWAGAYRTLLFVPVLVPPGVAAVTWAWIFHPILGLANSFLGLLGIPHIAWLSMPITALAVIVVVTAWKVFGLSFILFTAGLTTIDARLLDAARVDGATEWEVTTRIVLPLLRPTTLLVTILALVFAGQWSFAAVEVLTQGGPVGATNTVFHLLHAYAFRFFDTGRASALAVLLVIVFGGLALLQHRVSRRAGR